MSQIVVMADVEQLLCDYLAAEMPARGFTGLAIGTTLANVVGQSGNRAPESLIVFRTGGPRRTLRTDQPTVTIEGRAPDENRAHDLTAMALAVLHAVDGQVLDGHQVYSVEEFGGLANLPDPVTKLPRYTATLAVHIAGTVVA